MPNVFTNYKNADIGTSPVTAYTVPASTTSVVVGCNLANTSASQVEVDVQIGSVYLIKGVAIPAKSALSVLDGKIILDAADTVVITSTAETSVDSIISVLEQS